MLVVKFVVSLLRFLHSRNLGNSESSRKRKCYIYAELCLKVTYILNVLIINTMNSSTVLYLLCSHSSLQATGHVKKLDVFIIS